MLKRFAALPTEERVKAMCERDYLWCALHLLLDEEERLAALCPACQERAQRTLCPACGDEMGMVQGDVNESFDWTRFSQMREGVGSLD